MLHFKGDKYYTFAQIAYVFSPALLTDLDQGFNQTVQYTEQDHFA